MIAMIINRMESDGYRAVIRYNSQTDELRCEFRTSLDFFLETCAKRGINPHKLPVKNQPLHAALPEIWNNCAFLSAFWSLYVQCP